MSSAGVEKNLLQHEKSPYLLQHQTNPVQWYPWGEAAFEKAKNENKPIFLSVGYSTCHWCHVMAHESFENAEIATLMNEFFVNVKLDREERPDIDRIYMTFINAVSGSGGWPMSVWMTHELKPFYGGTYYPPGDRYYGRPGFTSLITSINDQWKDNKEKFTETSEKIIGVLARSAILPFNETLPDYKEVMDKCCQQLTRSFEPAHGGFSEQPKFPQPVNLHFLLQYEKIKPGKNCLKMVEKTLKGMVKGGIHDHVGQGFARYSTDKFWKLPHFEKMLYDQAQMTICYANAWLMTTDKFYADIVNDILTYVGRDLSHEEGGFYSAEDADSLPKFESEIKKEGAFYVWTKKEIDDILNEQVGDKLLGNIYAFRYGVKEGGNVDPYQDPHDELTNQNVIHESKTLEETAKEFSLPVKDVEQGLEKANTILFNYRNVNRPRPHLDSKFITSWNGLMISGYCRGGMALNKPEYIARAEKALEFIEKYMYKGGLIRTAYKDLEKGSVINLSKPIPACVDDFSNLIAACLDLFEATGKEKYLALAIKLQDEQDDLFWDSEKGGYFNSRNDDQSVIVRMKDDDDGAEPSSNSTSLINLIRLCGVTDKNENKIFRLLAQFSDRIAKVPISLPLMSAALPQVGKRIVIKVFFKDEKLINILRSHSLPTGTSVLPIANSEKYQILEKAFKKDFEEFSNMEAPGYAICQVGKERKTFIDPKDFETFLKSL